MRNACHQTHFKSIVGRAARALGAVLCLALAYSHGPAYAQTAERPPMVAAQTELLELSSGHGFVEGPAVDADGTLFFTDLGNGTINALRDGALSVFRSSRADAANGLSFDGQGRLYACEGGSGRVTRTEADGRLTVLADQFEGTRFNAPNDLAIASDGSVYFTDPYFGSRTAQPQPVTGVYRIAADSSVDLVISYLDRPNGIALSPDESTLYVTNDNPAGIGEIHVFDVDSDGMPRNGRLFATAASVMDGMAIDASGTLYATSFVSGRTSSGRGVWVFASDGQHLGLIPIPEQPTNCTLAHSTLYITASTRVFSIALNLPATNTAVQRITWAQIKKIERP
jgi:sugar lactone lactonase YvrE